MVVSGRSKFVTGAVSRDFSTRGSFSKVGGSFARKLRFGICVAFGGVLAAKRLVRAAACES